MSWVDEIRRAQEDHDDHFRESLKDAWEDVTTLPTTVTVMGERITWDSTKTPPWATAVGPPDTDDDDPATTLTSSTPATTTAIHLTDTTVDLPTTLQTSTTHPQTGQPPIPITTSAPGTATNTASASASTSCTSTSGVDNGAAELPHTKGGGYGNNGGVTQPPDSSHGDPGGPPLGIVVASALIPAVVIALAAFAIFLLLRRRKQRRDAEDAPEMKLRLSEDFPSSGPPEQTPPPPAPTPAPAPALAPRPQTPPIAVTPIPPPPPVIISAINPAGNSAYFTGIDTSEALSVRTNSVRSGPGRAGFMLDGEFHEEPPPPYRPRSVPPISRDSSMRTNCHADCPVNPFADPSDDDDNGSIMSGVAMDPYSRRTDDHLSVVSDLSYQMEPAAVHQAV